MVVRHTHERLPWSFTGLVVLIFTTPASTLPEFFRDETLTTGLNRPIDLVFLPDGRALVASKKCAVYILDFSSIPRASDIYLEITGCTSGGEKGILGLVLDPDFENDAPYIYIYYTADHSPSVRVERFTHTLSTSTSMPYSDPTSSKIVWSESEGSAPCCHYGGSVTFGPEKHLYITVGDKFNASSAQDLNSAAGKIHRVMRNGSVPQNNLGVVTEGALDTIWAYGLRNPFRTTWDEGVFLIADVGGNVNENAREDVHIGRPGVNFGWPLCEGYCGELPSFTTTCRCATGEHDSPIYSYEHGNDGGAIVGGIVYRSTNTVAFPSEYQGAYFYADYVKGEIRYAHLQHLNRVVGVKPHTTIFHESSVTPVALKQGPGGALYYISFDHGEVHRITVFPKVFLSKIMCPKIIATS